MTPDILYYKSDNVIRIKGPVDVTTGAPVTSISSAIAWFYHDDKDGYLTQAVSTTDTELFLNTVENLEVGDQITIDTDAGAQEELGPIVSINNASRSIVVTNPLGSNNDAGARTSVKLMPTFLNIAAPYGTPSAGAYDWGYYGILLSTIGWMVPGIPVRIERTLTSSAGSVFTQTTRHVVALNVSI
jgi:hypothetical protein